MDTNAQMIISKDPEKSSVGLSNFLEMHSNSFTFPDLNHNNYRREIWQAVYKLLTNPKYSHIHFKCLNVLRILSRDKTEINELVNDDLMNIINEHSGFKEDKTYDNKNDIDVGVEALKCLCNFIFNSPVAAAISCKNGTLEGIIRRLRTYRDSKLPHQVKYFDIKILFLITALCPEIRQKVAHELHGLTYLIETMDLILKENIQDSEKDGQDFLQDQQLDITCEILKCLFNLTLQNPESKINEEEEMHFMKLVSILHDYLIKDARNDIKKNDLHNHIINLLTNMPNCCFKNLYVPIQQGQEISNDLRFEEENMSAINKIVQFLHKNLNSDQAVTSVDCLLSPVLTTLLKATSSNRALRKYLRSQILPPLKDVRSRPEEGTTLRNRLCKLLTSPSTQVRDLVAELLFLLCKENVDRMIKYTGYGNAAGLFASRGLLGGKNGDTSNYSSDSEESDTEEYKQLKHGINPVMGCYEEAHPNPTAHMTEEQKEYEAMKLVELMDNLTRTGLVKPCQIGKDGKPKPVEHVLQLQEGLKNHQFHMDDDSD